MILRALEVALLASVFVIGIMITMIATLITWIRWDR